MKSAGYMAVVVHEHFMDEHREDCKCECPISTEPVEKTEKDLAKWQEEIREDQRQQCAKDGKDWLHEWFYFENKAGLSSGEALLAIKKAILNAGKREGAEVEK